MKVAVVTCSLGGYDRGFEMPAQTVPHELIDLAETGWGGALHHAHPRMLAKVPKCRPDMWTDADVMIWVDGSFQILSPDFVRWCIDSLGDGSVGMIRHPHRTTIMAEAEVSAGMTKYQGHPVIEQARHYQRLGYEDQSGLWATGLIVWRNRPSSADLGDAWLAEQLRWTWQDQISLPFLLWKHGVTVTELAGPIYPHPMFNIRAHHRED